MCDIYYGTTSYHVILFSCIINNKLRDGELVFSPKSKSNKRFCNLIRNWNDNPFSKIRLYDRSKPNRLYRGIKSLYWSKVEASKIISEVKPKYIYVSVDNDIFAQSMMEKNRNGKSIYVEDGMDAYNDSGIDEESYVTSLLRKMMFNEYQNKKSTYGTTKWIDCIKATHPNLLRDELSKRKRCGIDPDSLKAYNFRQMINRIPVSLPSSIDKLILVPYSKIYNVTKYIKAVKQHGALSGINGVSIKFHPRESVQIVSKYRETFSVIPKYIPLEIILKEYSIKDIYGLTSTALKSAKWMGLNSNLFSLYDTMGMSNKRMRSVMESIGIQII